MTAQHPQTTPSTTGQIEVAAPVVPSTVRVVAVPDNLATIGRRVGAWTLDVVAATVVFWVPSILVGGYTTPWLGMLVGLGLVATLWMALAREGRTPGKAILDLRVVDADTHRPMSTFRFALRGAATGACAAIPVVGWLLWALPLFDSRNQSAGGKVTNSIVVRD